MDPALENLGWTEEQWNRICTTVTEEAQKARVAAQVLPVTGPEEGSTVAVPNFTLTSEDNQSRSLQPSNRLAANSEPRLPITTIAVNVQLRSHEVADPELKAALVMFRRAANIIARIEDALVFNGRLGANRPPPAGLGGVPRVFTVTGDGVAQGLLAPAQNKIPVPLPQPAGQGLVAGIVAAIGRLEGRGQLGPYACILGHQLFEEACNPNANFVLPRDRILPFLQGPLARSSAIPSNRGTVIALSGSPVDLVVACDIGVRFLQTTLEPRAVFRVAERVALRMKEDGAIALLRR